ncbi:hypothetical protein BG418_04730 [Streptomyces sp. CBMA152]|nr:hypothetical protein [Streptomyces sp. CBMA152]
MTVPLTAREASWTTRIHRNGPSAELIQDEKLQHNGFLRPVGHSLTRRTDALGEIPPRDRDNCP